MHQFRLPINEHIDFVYPTWAHALEIYQVIEENRAYLKRFLPWAETLSLEDEREFLRVTLEKVAQGTALLYLIYQGDQLIGMIDLHNWNQTVRKAEVGYWLSEASSGQGIMTAALEKYCDIAFTDLNVNKIALRANTENHGSNRVAEKVGFRFVGVKHEEEIDEEQYISLNEYECLKKDFYQQKGAKT